MISCSNDDIVLSGSELSPDGGYSLEGESYISISAEKEMTRSTLQDNEEFLNFKWDAGDQLVVVHKDAGVIGFITTAEGSGMSTEGGSVTAKFEGTVKGKLDDGDKLRFYFLGNRNVDLGTKTIDVDFSVQDGLLESASALRFSATDEVTMHEQNKIFVPEGNLVLETKVTILKFAISYTISSVTGTDSSKLPVRTESVYNASDVVINGVANSATINFCADDNIFVSGQAKNSNGDFVNTITMAHTSDQSSPYFYVALPVFAEGTIFASPQMKCVFFDDAATCLFAKWTKWTMGSGKYYAGTGGKGMKVSFYKDALDDYTDKIGYNGDDILGGIIEDAGFTSKDGYNGENSDGGNGSGDTDKNGYNGENPNGGSDGSGNSDKNGYNGKNVGEANDANGKTGYNGQDV